MKPKRRNTAGRSLAKFSALVIAIIVVGVGGVWWNYSRPVGTGELQKFEVAKGESVAKIAQNLKQAGLIRSELYFRYLVKKNKYVLQAGVYQLGPAAPPAAIAKMLTIGQNEAIRIVIPEGFRREQIAEVIESNLGSSSKEFLTITKNEEGKLFPDTYFWGKEMSPGAIATSMENNYLKKAGEVSLDDLILASLIERETKNDEEKPIVAGILKKRLEAGWPLELDATIQYIKGKHGDWWPNTTLTDRKIKSAYNTYLNLGLPPSPICNPGLSAIAAAQNPTESPYWFYLHEPDGTIHYAESVAEHNENIDKFLR